MCFVVLSFINCFGRKESNIVFYVLFCVHIYQEITTAFQEITMALLGFHNFFKLFHKHFILHHGEICFIFYMISRALLATIPCLLLHFTLDLTPILIHSQIIEYAVCLYLVRLANRALAIYLI